MTQSEHDEADIAEARGWLDAAGDDTVAGLIESVFAESAAEIAERGPACWASGRCCNFGASGHRLYVTGLEAAYTMRRLESPLQSAALESATTRDGCPFQDANLCTVHTIKPLACRTYFCDRSAKAWQHALTERGVERLRAIHDMHHVPYRYAEWRWLLGVLMAAGDTPAS
ncbi:MAG: YkgJ family cysteine cluster protein [Planctomycetota bacterium]